MGTWSVVNTFQNVAWSNVNTFVPSTWQIIATQT